MLARSGDAHRALPRPPLANRHDPVFQDTRLEPFSDQTDGARVTDPVLQETDQPFLADRIEEGPDVRIENVVHLLAADSDDQSVQRVVRAAPWSEPIREPEEVFLVDRVQHRDGRPLDNFVLKGGNRERALPAIRLRYVLSPGWQCPIRPPLDPCVQILELRLKVCPVVPPHQPVHAGCSVSLECEERQPEQVDADMVEERGESFLLPLLSDLPYAAQRLGHAFPVLCPARAVLTRIPLGPRPSLHRLRSRLPGLVRRLRRYYGGV